MTAPRVPQGVRSKVWEQCMEMQSEQISPDKLKFTGAVGNHVREGVQYEQQDNYTASNTSLINLRHRLHCSHSFSNLHVIFYG